MTTQTADEAPPTDLGAVIDNARIGGIQIRVFILCGAIALLDGYDTLVIGFAAPSLAEHLGIARSELGPVFAVGLLGAAIGGLILGPLGDRIGRKPMLIASGLIFALFCGLTAFITTMPQLLACRFLAGIGLGGAAPCFVALTSEFAPARFRATAVTLMWASLPLGGVLGGLVSAVAVPTWGWTSLFYFGGIAPLIAVIAVALWLPESPRFLARSERGRDRLTAIVRALDKSAADRPLSLGTRPAGHAHGSVRALFADNRGVMTALLWCAFFFAATLAVLVPLWTPTLLQDAGYSVARSSMMVVLFNGGAIFGMAALGFLIDRYGVSVALISIFVIGALGTAPIGLLVGSELMASILFILSGIGGGGGAAGIVALTAMLYPTELRSTGVGWAAAMGRVGQMLGPVASGALIALGLGIGAIFFAFALLPTMAAVFIVALGVRGLIGGKAS